MVVSMLVSHLVGDYVLQPDALAEWKARELKGVLVHGAVVCTVTWLFTLPFDGRWWTGVAMIGGGHVAIDVIHFALLKRSTTFRTRYSPLRRFLLDQAAHLALIGGALAAGGYLTGLSKTTLLGDNPIWLQALGYIFVTMPAWVLIKFVIGGLLDGAPDFATGPNKYVGMIYRILMTALVATGQFILVPLVPIGQLLAERPQGGRPQQARAHLLEVMASVTLATAVGLLLRALSR